MTFKEARYCAGLSTREVADSLGTYASTVSSWEAGHARPSPKFVPKLALLYNLTPLEVTRLEATR